MQMDFDHILRSIAEDMGTSFFGVANLAPAHEAILSQGGPVLADFPRAISVGIVLLSPIVDQLPQRANRSVAMSYRHHCYDVVNSRLDFITSRLSTLLQNEGHRALPVAASQTVDDELLCGIFSNKMAAHLAGLGWIGKSCLLITPEVGPRARWATVLTDAPLQTTGEPLDDRCGACSECVDICPPGAFTGRPFHPREPRAARFAAHKCSHYFDEIVETGQCRSVGYACTSAHLEGSNDLCALGCQFVSCLPRFLCG